MDNNFSNYDMLDKMIANNKKAKSWTAFWILLLCLMAAAVLWLAHTVSEKNKAILKKDEVIIATTLNLEQKSRIIDSLTENCNDAKTEIIKNYDSVITETQMVLDIVNPEKQSVSNTKFTPVQQKKIEEANSSIEKVRNKLKITKAEIKKNNTRLFIQYNDEKNKGLVQWLQTVLKDNTEYIIAPPEYIEGTFGTVIKFYNYRNADEENSIKKLISEIFKIPVNNIAVKYEKNPKLKTTVEVWIGTTP